MNAGPELTGAERAEVERILKTTGWLDARDCLRARGYTLEQANDIVLPRGRGGPSYSAAPSDSSPPQRRSFIGELVENIGQALGWVFFWSR
jgi:hypothetical protein